jgi:hypothetical protein
VPPEQHKDQVFIHSTYMKKMKKLEEEPDVTAAVKCQESQKLNWQLMIIERALFDAGDIKEHDALGPLTYLRSGASAAGAWGMISLPAPPPGCSAFDRSADGGAAGSAAAAASDDADGDDPSDGDKKKKPRRKKQAKPTLELFQNYSEQDWVDWYQGAEPRLVWSADYYYEVWVDTAEGKKKYKEPVMKQLLEVYWRGGRCVEIDVTLDDGRHTGHEHKYVVYWIGGAHGHQFNKLVKDAAVRGVTIIKTKWEPHDAWQSPGPSLEWEERAW